MPVNQVEVMMKVTATLERLGIAYIISGSFASSAHGNPRATMDVDLLAALKSEHVRLLFDDLKSEFYVNEQSMLRAVRTKHHFNAIHFDTSFKVDIFIAEDSGFDIKQLERATLEVVSEDQQSKAYVATAEDTVLAKLDWYRRGNEVSEQQWKDILGVIEVQGERLDLDYLSHWAKELRVSDLLEQAIKEVKQLS